MDEVYRFGRFALNVDRLRLTCDGKPVEVEPKPLEVLAELLRGAGELVTKNELMDSVWAGRIITESVIARCISKLRVALDDQAQTLILTVHGYGYRFAGTARRLEEPGPEGAEEPRALHPGDAPPQRPHWRLARALDQAGCVWLAEHDKTGERRVFKFALEPRQVRGLKRELTIHRLLQRSLGERDDIARLLDYNLEAAPYFLELEHCQQGSLADWWAAQGGAAAVPLATRIALLAQAARALGAAHGVGVLHLDIKPSNLLIWTGQDGAPHIRWTDFGSARLDDAGRLAALGITRLGSTRTIAVGGPSTEGTLQYIAPEVLNGEPPTVRSDLYALGVMLYQLAAGDLRKPMSAGWEDNVADEVLRGDIAAAANGNPALRPASADELAARLRGLERRRAELAEQRRQAAESAELRRRLERARARRPWALAAGIALCAGLAASLWSYRQALRAETEARRAADTATGVSRFLTQDLLGSPSSFNPSVRRDITVKEAMDRGLDALNRETVPPLVEAQVRYSIAYVYMQMADYDDSIKQKRRVAELFSAALGPGDPRTLEAQYGAAEDLLFAGRYAESAALLDRLDTANDPSEALSSAALHGADYLFGEQYARALPYYEKALALYQARPPAQQEAAALCTRHTMLALTHAHLGQFDQADTLIGQALADAGRDATLNRDTTLALGRESAGVVRYLEGRYAEAEPLLAAAHEALVKDLGPDEQESAESGEYLGLVFLETGRGAAALDALSAARAAYAARLGAAHPAALIALAHLGMAEAAAGRDTAASDLRQAHDGLAKALGPTAPDTEYAAFQLARLQSGAPGADLLAQLDPDVLRQAAPQRDWARLLAGLRGQLQQGQGGGGRGAGSLEAAR